MMFVAEIRPNHLLRRVYSLELIGECLSEAGVKSLHEFFGLLGHQGDLVDRPTLIIASRHPGAVEEAVSMFLVLLETQGFRTDTLFTMGNDCYLTLIARNGVSILIEEFKWPEVGNLRDITKKWALDTRFGLDEGEYPNSPVSEL